MEVSGHFHAPAALLPDKGPGYNRAKGDWMGPRVGMDALKKRKIACLCRESNHDSSVVWPIT